MGILDMWREARGNVMRRELDDILTRMRNANEAARSAFLNNVDQTVDELRDLILRSSPAERKALLKQARKAGEAMWASGDWPSALGLGISALNAESHTVPGEDAAYVRRETERLIAEARLDGLPRSN